MAYIAAICANSAYKLKKGKYVFVGSLKGDVCENGFLTEAKGRNALVKDVLCDECQEKDLDCREIVDAETDI